MNPPADHPYVMFAERLMATFAHMDHDGDALIGLDEIQTELELGADPGQPGDETQGLHDCLEDLRKIGAVTYSDVAWVRPTDHTLRIRHEGTTLRETWPDIFAPYLSPDQSAFLAKLVELAPAAGARVPTPSRIQAVSVLEAMGWSVDDHDPSRLAEALRSQGFTDDWSAGYDISIRPTYAGVVRVTEQVATEWQERLRVLLAEGETSTVDIKRELHVDAVREKGEFIRDVLGLATTKASGRDRYLLVGFDDETAEFVASVDTSITRERLEQVVNAYTDPKPELDWVPVPVAGGVAGVVIVRRDPAKVPYRVAKAIWKLTPGGVYVRHGTHTESPTERELETLVAEGERARSG